MSTLNLQRASNSCVLVSSCFNYLKTCVENIHEFFTHQKATIQKIESLNQRIFKTERLLHSGSTFNDGLFEFKEILLLDAQMYNQRFKHCKIRKAYENMRSNLERVHKNITPESVRQWVNHDRTAEKITVSRWLLSNPSQRHFAAHYRLADVPYKFSDIPAGSILLTDPYAYLKHMKIEKRTPIIHSIILKIKALVCRFLTGKQFTHVGFSMGNGRIFDLDKKSDTWLRGDGRIRDFGDKVFYGVVMAPKEEEMLEAHNKHFPLNPCFTFQELMGKINAEIEIATKNESIQLNVIDIMKTAVPKKRPKDYNPSLSWKSGACHYSCSGTTSALLSFFGIVVQPRKKDENVTPTDFYQSRFFHPIYLIP
jgi:hypothetical protein